MRNTSPRRKPGAIPKRPVTYPEHGDYAAEEREREYRDRQKAQALNKRLQTLIDREQGRA